MSHSASFVTPLCSLLGCRYPIIQTAMGWVAGPALVAATGNAGGFGFLAGATIPADEMEANIKQVKQLSSAPFGVNFHMYQPNATELVNLVVKYKVRAVSYSRSPNAELIKELKAHAVTCMPTVGLPKHAIKAVELGADAVTVQGGEGGGHTGTMPTSLLIPQVVKVLDGKVPIAAAGGFQDGYGLVAALAWGADGVAMGTRFLMSNESMPPKVTKQRYIDCDNPDDVIVSRALDGLPQRMINNETLTKLENASSLRKLFIAVANGLKYRRFSDTGFFRLLGAALSMARAGDITLPQAIMSANAPMIIQRSMVDGQPQLGVLPSGQVASVISELKSCEEIIQSIVAEASTCIEALVKYKNSC